MQKQDGKGRDREKRNEWFTAPCIANIVWPNLALQIIDRAKMQLRVLSFKFKIVSVLTRSDNFPLISHTLRVICLVVRSILGLLLCC